MQFSITPSKNINVSSSLRTFNVIKFKQLLGPERVKQYQANNYNLRLVYDLLSDNLEGDKMLGVFSNIIGLEFNTYVVEYLKRHGVREIEIEQDIGTTRVDTYAHAHINKSVPFECVKLDGTSTKIYLLGNHTFENKACRKVPKKSIAQIKKARGYYKKNTHNHVLTLKDSCIKKGIHKAILELGGDVLRADITKADLINRINGLKIKLRTM